MAPAEYMEMQVKHRLPAVSSDIGHNAVAGIRHALHACYLGAGEQQVPHQSFIALLAILHRCDVPLRDHQ